MKKISIFIFVIAMIGSLNAQKLEVLTSFTILADIAKNVAKDSANVNSLTKMGTEIHGYEATPKDILKAKKADIILYNGLNLELWMDKFLSNAKKPSYNLSDGVTPIFISDGGYKGKPNPHAWMNIKNVQIYIKNIVEIFSRHDPKNADIYAKNADEYIKILNDLDSKFKAEFAKVPLEQRYLITSEGAFSYLTKEYDLKELYIWSVNSDEQGTTKQIKNLVDKIKNSEAKVIFSESTISPKPAMTIANESGIRYGGVLYVDSLSKEIPTYVDLMKTTVSTIINGLNNGKN
ncbi:metal ABC transporter substrate-binding protein [Campylobacter fetus]|uniref:metal ABC transporter substrate-binding protein n=1 Tax=Campylobacter fetus TaxID=196 RepID=UPI0008189C43|nr:metal ABC transporter substrate-binding protein [Campylobacter fetus]EAH8299582.1 metal ABC transporter substrate-binding protein [Campylobacter fetus]EAI7232179.1 metal ABC transporter substrate-binding protein [Campylobacter fetus]EAJ5690815.1 metal ABC transporter substrate-binding protein [Campylobacter fetus]EAK0427686.1 metal ABC transporter substrate-binding protein [Campylobacter fetus]EAK5305033.1 metal ABC transporter substrate-binding protein [Campylobacter fetus]